MTKIKLEKEVSVTLIFFDPGKEMMEKFDGSVEEKEYNRKQV